VNAKAQAEAVLDALCARYPAPTDEFHANFDKLAADLDKLAARAATISARLEGQTLAASHPAYNYLARRNGWQIQNFTLDPETPLEPADWENLRGGLSAMPVIVMLWEAEPLEETSKMLFDDQGLTSVVFSPAETLAPEQRAKGEDYLTIMNANFGRLEDALGTATVPMSDEPVDE
jgi:zinc transport system substrate-binding protein